MNEKIKEIMNFALAIMLGTGVYFLAAFT